MSLIAETRNLSHRFGGFQALDGIDLAVPAGAVYGFLGPNGSGKTTTIRILLGLLRPQGGQVSIFGLPMPRARLEIARHVGSMVETPCLYDHLSGFDNVDLARRAMGLAGSETGRVLELVDLTAFAARRAGSYSLGMRQRLGIARALLGQPKLLILDEPTNGLDPAGVHDMRRLIRDLPQALGVTVFVSSHLLNEVEQVASHVGLMSAGQLIAQSSLNDLLESVPSALVIGVRDAFRAATRLQASDIDGVAEDDTTVVVRLRPGHSPDAGQVNAGQVNALLVGAGFEVFALQVRTPSLEDVFLQRTAA